LIRGDRREAEVGQRRGAVADDIADFKLFERAQELAQPVKVRRIIPQRFHRPALIAAGQRHLLRAAGNLQAGEGVRIEFRQQRFTGGEGGLIVAGTGREAGCDRQRGQGQEQIEQGAAFHGIVLRE
jgi:hypothetical protein